MASTGHMCRCLTQAGYPAAEAKEALKTKALTTVAMTLLGSSKGSCHDQAWQQLTLHALFARMEHQPYHKGIDLESRVTWASLSMHHYDLV